MYSKVKNKSFSRKLTSLQPQKSQQAHVQINLTHTSSTAERRPSMPGYSPTPKMQFVHKKKRYWASLLEGMITSNINIMFVDTAVNLLRKPPEGCQKVSLTSIKWSFSHEKQHLNVTREVISNQIVCHVVLYRHLREAEWYWSWTSQDTTPTFHSPGTCATPPGVF